MNPVLVAHGTRKGSGVAMIGDLAEQVSRLLDRRVHTAFVDVLGPTPAEVLSTLPPGPAVVVPAFLSSGYHVHVDIPAGIAASGHPDVTVTAALGPSTAMVRVLTDRLIESGWRPTDSVVLAAAGTSDPRAASDLRRTCAMLSATLGSRVELAFAINGTYWVGDVVARLRKRGAGRVAVASYLLADGLFQDRLHACGADLVTDPLGRHPGVAKLVAHRFRTARISLAA
ncbi:cobalamin biosynthesis protein CbiX [Mycobacterium sp. CBMA 234]|uniref:sirohydrochlorin chelatase n=1 Tax=Mycolicibacterium sp. CBMA 234 TaxID=1918495 RepID=UPI0013913C8E|nr:sirohydrochlorin chelatase [Mycolicibacterium sp. CBMA 234]MUL64694.1 cobalamin biosynthesis protein CbiX [Mycolicibacterium sp. CBMA 234]